VVSRAGQRTLPLGSLDATGGSIIVSGLPTPGDHASQVQVKQLAGAVAKGVGDQPFMVMTHAGHGLHDDATLDGFWTNLRGWRLILTLNDSGHYSYTDDEQFLSQLVRARIIPASVANQVVIPAIGTIDPARAVATERAYIGAFFDLHLRHRGSRLMDRPSPRYPDIQFIAT
jgi:hypothetical protein